MRQNYKLRVDPVVSAEQWTGPPKWVVVRPACGASRTTQVRSGDWLVYDDQSGTGQPVSVLSDDAFRATYEPVEHNVEAGPKTVLIAPSPMRVFKR